MIYNGIDFKSRPILRTWIFYWLITDPAVKGVKQLSSPRLSWNLYIGFKVPEVIMIERGFKLCKALKANSGDKQFN